MEELCAMRVKPGKIIIDTNLWISYLITKGFKRLDKQIYSDKALLIFSQELIDEFIEVQNVPNSQSILVQMML